ncbi:hypothetical protein Nmel_001223 [Mimus melanotis]
MGHSLCASASCWGLTNVCLLPKPEPKFHKQRFGRQQWLGAGPFLMHFS